MRADVGCTRGDPALTVLPWVHGEGLSMLGGRNTPRARSRSTRPAKSLHSAQSWLTARGTRMVAPPCAIGF